MISTRGISKELLGLALLTVLVVLVVKGFYLDLLVEVRTLRGEVTDLTRDGDGVRYSKAQIVRLRTRLDRAVIIKEKSVSRSFQMSELAALLETLAGEEKVGIVSMTQTDENLQVWELVFSGGLARLTRFLHGLEEASLPLVITRARFKATSLVLWVEVKR